MQNPPGRHVEQIEIIETHVTESRRPISSQDRSLNSTGVQNFGYDVNEVHTTEGGARVVTQHGNKDKMNLPPSYQPSSTMTSKREAFSEVLQSSTYHPESSYTKSALANQNSRVGFSTLSPFASTIHDTTYHQSKTNSLAALGMSNINNSSPPLQSILKHERNSWQQSQVSDDNRFVLH
uniref:Uncharacterized protein n=1 Tax=Rhabditophanes sp. KR3021 TaxID=114890 RepID=A0AC35TFT0_9BILA